MSIHGQNLALFSFYMTTKPTPHIYYPALDTLRAIAILLVIIGHWLPYQHILNSFLTNGPLGVVLFFVLSGYLITGILLNEKTKLDAKQKTVGGIFKSFYIKRSLRIFPIYYLTLLYLLIMHIPDVTEYFWWHFFYGSNFLFYFSKSFFSEYVSPLWSLSVEEQFYLFWPFIILFSSRKQLLGWFVVCVIAGTALRMMPESLHEKPFSYFQFLMPTCIDCFAVGGIIAYVQRFHSEKLALFKKVCIGLAFAGLAYLLLVVQMYGPNDFVTVVFNRTIFSCFAAAFILYVITPQAEESLLHKNLENSLLVYIGKISYSMYLWHNLIPYFLEIESEGKRFFVRLGVLIALSTLSYFALEKPLLSLKKYVK
jgi:peptidoglycan/LPS O-acetylase OafA/YrhL